MTAAPPSSVLAAARAYVAAGLSVIPIGLDGRKQPAFDVLPRVPDPDRPDRVKPTWKPFEERPPTEDELERWFDRPSPYGIALACGAVSGGAECIDFDDRDTAREFCRVVLEEEPELYAALSLEKTPRGLHVWYTTDAGEGNRTLAGQPDGFDGKGKPKRKKTIETRGQGGYAIVAGSPVAVHELRKPYEYVAGPALTALVRISAGDRDYLFRLAMSFDRDDPRPEQDRQRSYTPGELSPGDDYDLRGEPFCRLLPDAHFVDGDADTGNVRRPGKDRGTSATVGHCKGKRGEPLLKVFTSNWEPFEAEKCYGRFNVLRLTRFDGDGAAATRFLRSEGYGSPLGNPERNGKHTRGRSRDDGDGSGERGEEGGAAPAKPPLPLIYYADVLPSLDTADFIEGLLIDGGMSVIYGDSGSGKTFFTLDMCLHVAGGIPWRGREVERRGVLYLALEGAHGIKNRIAAFKEGNKANAADVALAVVPVSVDLLSPDGDVVRVIEAAKEAASRLSIPVGLIVVDTLSRAIAGGNENSPEDMGTLVKHIDLIRQALPAHVSVIHHSGKDAAKGARGHSCLRAATDTEIEIVRDYVNKTSVAKVTKQKDMEEGDEFAFRLEVVELGRNRRGKPVTSCVVRPADVETAPSKEDRAAQAKLEKERVGKAAEAKADEKLARAAIDAVRAAIKRGDAAASRSDIRRAVPAKRVKVDAIIAGLIEAGELVKTGPFKRSGPNNSSQPVEEGFALPVSRGDE